MPFGHPIRTLVIEGDAQFSQGLGELFNRVNGHNFIVDVAETLKQGLILLGRQNRASNQYDVVVLDLDMPDAKGLSNYYVVRDQFPSVPVVVLSPIPCDSAYQIIREGAQDYLVKRELDPKRLVQAMLFAIGRVQHTDARFRSSQNIRRLEELAHASP